MYDLEMKRQRQTTGQGMGQTSDHKLWGLAGRGGWEEGPAGRGGWEESPAGRGGGRRARQAGVAWKRGAWPSPEDVEADVALEVNVGVIDHRFTLHLGGVMWVTLAHLAPRKERGGG